MGFDFNPFASSRREYGEQSLDVKEARDCPVQQFEQWFADAVSQEVCDPTAMVLSTVDAKGCPNSRVVLLKGIESGAFVFYTNYESTKSLELQHNAYAALNFYWAALARQVRIRGTVQRVSREASEAYFATRSRSSQCSAVVSPQSHVIQTRDALVQKADQLMASKEAIPCPDYWGGFAVLPETFEFWQGRDHRLHDRIFYEKKESLWVKLRLAS